MFSTGVGMAMRVVGNKVKPNITIKVEGNKVTITSTSTFKTTEISCTLGEEFDETTADDRKVKVKGQDLLSSGGGWFQRFFCFFFCKIRQQKSGQLLLATIANYLHEITSSLLALP